MNAAYIPSIYRILAAVGFVTLFPIFFLYHLAISQGVVGPVLGGLFGPATAVFLPISLLMVIYFSARYDLRHREPVFVLFLLFVSWVLIWILLNIFGDPNNLGHEQNLQITLFWVVMFSIGLYLPTDSQVLASALVVLWATLTVLSILFVDTSTLMTESAGGQSSTYQGLARSVLITSFFVVASVRKAPLRWLVSGVSIVSLFLIGARAELYGFLGSYALIELVINRRSFAARLGFFLAVLAIALVIMSNFEVLRASRQLEIFDISGSTSWQARSYLQDFAVMQILDNPFLGVYAGHWFLGEGDYAHNILSVWVSFGVLGFILYSLLCLVGLTTSIRALIREPSSTLARVAALANSTVFLLVIVSQPVFWEVPGIAWGLALSASIERRLRESRMREAKPHLGVTPQPGRSPVALLD